MINNGTVARLQDMGISVHARSVLLQGLLLQSPLDWPDHLSSAFRSHHARWIQQLEQEGLSPLSGALGFVRACEGIEAVLVGVISSTELSQVLQVWQHHHSASATTSFKWAWENYADLDPRCWSS